MCNEGLRALGRHQTGLGKRRSHRSCPAAGHMPGQGSRPHPSHRRSPACHRSAALRAGSVWIVPRCRGRCPQGTGSPVAQRQAPSSCPHRSHRHTHPRCCTAMGPAGTCHYHSGTRRTGRMPGPASLWEEEFGKTVRGEQSLAPAWGLGLRPRRVVLLSQQGLCRAQDRGRSPGEGPLASPWPPEGQRPPRMQGWAQSLT